VTKIFIDPGHGGTDAGASGNGLQEKKLTLQIAARIRSILLDEYTGAEIRMSRTSDQTVSLKQRTDSANAWGADFYLSVHINAGGGTGFETYIYPGAGQATVNYQNIIHDQVIKQGIFSSRGKKQADFHVLRESAMPALLTENGFIDHAGDAAKLKQAASIEKIARGHAEGLASAFGFKKKSTGPPPPDTFLIKVKAAELWYYDRPDWNARAGIVKAGEVFTVVETILVNGSRMYKLKSGNYITANPQYVQKL
jgi:N-acetylmuramoyl-L-alanine amidase